MQLITLLLASLLIVGAHAAPKPSEQQQQSSSPSQAVPAQSPQSVQQQASPSDPNQVAHSQQQAQQSQQGHSQYVSPFSSYYSPAGIVSVINGAPASEPVHATGAGKPQAFSRSVEQYGQPESTALPPNYKPFGSWGLYIGGNPADGYYTNYYKALSASVQNEKVDKPQTVLKASAPSGEAYYPYAYPQSELSTIYPHQQVSYQPISSHYGSPAYEPVVYEHAAPEAYATGRKVSQKEVVKSEAKAYSPAQSRVYVYAPPVVAAAAHTASAPVVATRSQQEHHQQQQQQQVVAYPVPLGSQIVGSQYGVDGAFHPYGVHAFTRYVVKPTFVGQETHSVGAQHSPASDIAYSSQSVSAAPVGHQPAYRVYYAGSAGGYYPYYNGNYYGYPVSQLHYSASSHSNVEHPEVHASGVHNHPFGVVGFKPTGAGADGKPGDEVKPVEGVSVDKRA